MKASSCCICSGMWWRLGTPLNQLSVTNSWDRRLVREDGLFGVTVLEVHSQRGEPHPLAVHWAVCWGRTGTLWSTCRGRIARWSSWDLNECLYGMPILQAAALFATPQRQPKSYPLRVCTQWLCLRPTTLHSWTMNMNPLSINTDSGYPNGLWEEGKTHTLIPKSKNSFCFVFESFEIRSCSPAISGSRLKKVTRFWLSVWLWQASWGWKCQRWQLRSCTHFPRTVGSEGLTVTVASKKSLACWDGW